MSEAPFASTVIDRVRSVLNQLSVKDSFYVSRQLSQFEQGIAANKPVENMAEGLLDKAIKALEAVDKRRQQLPAISYNESLPVSARRDEIITAIKDNQVVILAGETGSGKTTQLPKMCLEAGCGIRGLIGHTQPRRLAARTIAQRLSEELNTPLGSAVGYQVRFTDVSTPGTFIKQMTDGILLAETQNDKLLLNYDTLIIDEAHERSLNIDFLLGYLKKILPKRPDLKLIITSATIDITRFSEHFNHAPIINVEGRTFPVDIMYMGDDSAEEGLASQVVDAVNFIEREERNINASYQGDALVFLPGEREIREVALKLKREVNHIDVLPLYARLGQSEQQRIFDLGKRRGRRIVLATNVAETSVTVPGIRYVIDSGLARVSRYSVRSKIQRLPIEDISKASANQRKGRCGRVSEGLCIRLYSEDSFERRPDFTEPEILRTNLAAVILQMISLRLGDIRHFPFVERPADRLVNDGYKSLVELSALDNKHQLTHLGKKLGKLPVDPRLGRILLAGAQTGALREMLIITSALSIQDPKERPVAKQAQADQLHARFNDKQSDFMSWLLLWQYLEEQRQALSKTQFNKMCKREFLSPVRVNEWRDIYRQLSLAVKDLGLVVNPQPAGYDQVHKPLLAGFLSQIGRKEEGKQYIGARNRQFLIFPASTIYKKPPAWLVAAQLTETSKLYARCCGYIQAQWALDYAKHLVKYSYSEPVWKTSQGQVVAKETISLYGLVLCENNNVPYGSKDPVVTRDLFLRQALTERGLRSSSTFWKHNEKLLNELEALEKKTRSTHYQLNEQWLYDFYKQHIPDNIYSQRSLEKWLKQDQSRHQRLCLNKEELIKSDNLSKDQHDFPDHLQWEDLKLPLSYEFSPGKGNDGVTVTLPVGVLNRVPVALFEWLVPGLLHDKCIALLKGLPKPLRKHLVPVPAAVDKLIPFLKPGNTTLTQALSNAIKQHYGITVSRGDWSVDSLPALYQMKARVVSAKNKLIEESTDIDRLIENHKNKLTDQISRHKSPTQTVTDWQFKSIAKQQMLHQGGVDIKVFPALVDKGNSSELVLLDDPDSAEKSHRLGTARLLTLKLTQPVRYLKKELFKSNQTTLHFSVFQDKKDFIDTFIQAVVVQTFQLFESECRSQSDFEQLLKRYQNQLIPNALLLEKTVEQTLESHYAIHLKLKTLHDVSWAYAVDDIKLQLKHLFYDGFLTEGIVGPIFEYPRYFKALQHRLEKLSGHFQKDKQSTVLLAPYLGKLKQLQDQNKGSLSHSKVAPMHWLIEEYRVSLFAQHIKTRVPVSNKRLDKLWQSLFNG